MSEPLSIRPAGDCRWDCAALGEVMLRFDPGERRVRNARSFDVWEGGGEYNVARALAKTFGKRSTILTALPANDLGWLAQDLIGAGGVDMSGLIWRDFDGVGRASRLGLNFTERGFGVRPALGVSDRANSAASQIRPGEIDWERLFGEEGVRWFHTGGIFAALASNTAETVIEAVEVACRHGTIVSYDVNYRASLWQARGGREAARALNRAIAAKVDVILGFELEGSDQAAFEAALKDFPGAKVAATTIRKVKSATINDWAGALYMDGQVYASPTREDLEIFDRVGGGDGFASGVIYALLEGEGPQAAVDYGAAHGALVMTTPGDASMARLDEVEALLRDDGASVRR
ncbi:MAG: PfkB domain protein [Caulobacteraceae bacterium]|nr:PfkB domain protein [Caulobacteraceae bacterium]